MLPVKQARLNLVDASEHNTLHVVLGDVSHRNGAMLDSIHQELVLHLLSLTLFDMPRSSLPLIQPRLQQLRPSILWRVRNFPVVLNAAPVRGMAMHHHSALHREGETYSAQERSPTDLQLWL